MSEKSDREFVRSLRTVFAQVAGEDQRINQKQLQDALQLKNRYFADRVFSLFDEDGDGFVEQDEFQHAVEKLVMGTAADKLGFAFQLHDVRGEGHIGFAEMQQLIGASLIENNLRFTPSQNTELARTLFDEADVDADGRISYEDFKLTVDKYPKIREAMTVSAAEWLKPLEEKKQKHKRSVSRWTRIRRYTSNNSSAIIFLGLYILVNLILFGYAALGASSAGIFVQLARGAGACLKFNGMLILIPVMRSWLSWLRNTAVGNYLPLDRSYDFHLIVGEVLFWLMLVHGGANLAEFASLRLSLVDVFFKTRIGLTGMLILLTSTVIWASSRKFVRRRRFETFIVYHTAFIAWFALALIHNADFWKWAALPILGYLAERVWRHRRAKHTSYISSASVLPSGVTHLEIETPPGFEYQPGSYAYVRIPSISAREWHPFTISNSPEEVETLSLHVRSQGDWTAALHRHVATVAKASPDRIPPERIELEGPFGVSSLHIFESQTVILVGAGIGVTPFASILKSILHRSGDDLRLEKVYFYWMNREQRAFEWFTKMLAEIEQADGTDLFDLNIYMTSWHQDMTSSALSIAMDLVCESQSDLITGLQSCTHGGRPDWDADFRAIQQRHAPGKVDMFYCGPPGLGRELSKYATKYGFGYRRENF